MAGPAECDCAGRNSRRPIALLRRQQFGAAPKFCRDLPTGKLVRGLSGIVTRSRSGRRHNLFAELFAFPGLPRLTGSWQTRVLRETPDNERRGNESVAG